MECKHGIKPRFKEKEKVIADVDEEDYQLKDNLCWIEFKCVNDDECVYYAKSNIHYELCKYLIGMNCTSQVARTNAMIMELKGMGFKHVRLEG